MELNDHKGIEMNGMYLTEQKKWKRNECNETK